MTNIACPDIKLAIQTAIQLEALLETDRAVKLKGKVDQVILGCVMQLRLLTSDHCVGTPKGDVTRAYRALFMLLMTVSETVQKCVHRITKESILVICCLFQFSLQLLLERLLW
jgi:hypothetical protein